MFWGSPREPDHETGVTGDPSRVTAPPVSIARLLPSMLNPRSVIHTKGVMTDETDSQVLVVDKVYTKERIGFTFGGRRMRGWFEGSVTARSPVPTLAALLALHIGLRPESHLRTGEWKESGSAGG